MFLTLISFQNLRVKPCSANYPYYNIKNSRLFKKIQRIKKILFQPQIPLRLLCYNLLTITNVFYPHKTKSRNTQKKNSHENGFWILKVNCLTIYKLSNKSTLMRWWAISKKGINNFTIAYFSIITIHSAFIFLNCKK